MLADWIGIGSEGNVHVFGIKLVGVSAENGGKLLFTLLFVVLLIVLNRVIKALLLRLLGTRRIGRSTFWARQGINLLTAVAMVLGLVSTWFDDPTRLATALGLVTAGLAFALQKVVTSLAGYFVILQGKTFNVGDRITMGGIRGDVIALGFIQTTIMEMGQPPSVETNTDPAMWVRSRQYTGRIVTVTNDKIFDEPVYNYTRDFPYIWEEVRLPVAYRDDRQRVGSILLDVAGRHAIPAHELDDEARHELRRRYLLDVQGFEPRVYYRLTDNWLELTVRFVCREHGIREVKDVMSRDLLEQLEQAGIGIASATFEIVGVPTIHFEAEANGRVG